MGFLSSWKNRFFAEAEVEDSSLNTNVRRGMRTHTWVCADDSITVQL